MRVLTTSLLILAVLAYILGSIVPDGLGGLKTRLFPPAATRIVLPTATPVLPTPAPVAGPLAPPPADCPAAASFDTITAQPSGFSQPVQLFGRAPVWVPQGYLPLNPTILSQSGTPEEGSYPLLTILWAIGPTQHPAVTVRVVDLRSGEFAWRTNLSGLPATPVLTIPASAGVDGWLTTPATIAITHAGCYRLDVSWTGGGWYTIVAIGWNAPPAAAPRLCNVSWKCCGWPL